MPLRSWGGAWVGVWRGRRCRGLCWQQGWIGGRGLEVGGNWGRCRPAERRRGAAVVRPGRRSIVSATTCQCPMPLLTQRPRSKRGTSARRRRRAPRSGKPRGRTCVAGVGRLTAGGLVMVGRLAARLGTAAAQPAEAGPAPGAAPAAGMARAAAPAAGARSVPRGLARPTERTAQRSSPFPSGRAASTKATAGSALPFRREIVPSPSPMRRLGPWRRPLMQRPKRRRRT